jgi:cardiolipin synthase
VSAVPSQSADRATPVARTASLAAAPAVPRRDVPQYPEFADRAFARAAGSEPVDGNSVRLLLDARENFPAWLEAINGAKHSILFESYIFDDDKVGRQFAEALAAKARSGVHVHVVYDWLGSRHPGTLRSLLDDAGAKVRVFNRPRLDSPLGWLSRNHRKTISVDGRIGFASGLCVSAKWQGDPARRMEPWRDTGIQIEGPAVAELTRAFADVWKACGGESLSPEFSGAADDVAAGDVRVRVIAGTPSGTGTYRLDLVIAGLARRTLWLTDAYFVGTAAYVQALAAAARDGVDVRLLVPGASDIPALTPVSRASYRALLAAGVRVFEWNGTMLHAKTAVADQLWTRIGSTNLNIASWMGNYELDVAVEDRRFGEAMAAQYEIDLTRSTEIVLTTRNRVQPAERSASSAVRRARSGSAGRVAAGAVSVGSALGAALTNRRALGAAESGLLTKVGVVAIGVAIIAAAWPQAIAWPIAAIALWLGVAWLVKAHAVRRDARKSEASASFAPTEPTRGGEEGA